MKLDPQKENQFFHIFRKYFSLEKNTARKYSDREYSLARMAPIAELAGNPQDKLKILHVAGTKGKGSTVQYAVALLNSAGYKAGSFCSPHLFTFRERFMVDNSFLDYDLLLEKAENWEKIISDSEIKPSLFEILTVFSLMLFVEMNCDYAVLETGIGGLLDSTNYVQKPEACAITSISYDHTQLLGETIAEIAFQKAGIIKPGVPVVLAPQSFPVVPGVVTKVAAEKKSPLLMITGGESSEFNLPVISFMKENFLTACKMVEAAGIKPVKENYKNPELPGRMWEMSTSPLVVVDAAHNRDSARRLAEGIVEKYPNRKFTIVLGVVSGKDVTGIWEELQAVADSFILTNPELKEKGSQLDKLVELADNAGVKYQVVEELDSLEKLPEAPLLFTGSFFVATIACKLFN